MILICACCGAPAPARRQWYNRDTGYGVCARCFNQSVVKEGVEESIRLYGAPGIHHSLGQPERKPEPKRLPVEFNEADCGGVFDGFQVTSDADPGL